MSWGPSIGFIMMASAASRPVSKLTFMSSLGMMCSWATGVRFDQSSQPDTQPLSPHRTSVRGGPVPGAAPTAQDCSPSFPVGLPPFQGFALPMAATVPCDGRDFLGRCPGSVSSGLSQRPCAGDASIGALELPEALILRFPLSLNFEKIIICQCVDKFLVKLNFIDYVLVKVRYRDNTHVEEKKRPCGLF